MKTRLASAIALTLLIAGSAGRLAADVATATKPEVLPFIADDYGRALAAARAAKVPIFVETWAPWCHTCRSMKAFVFTDKKLQPEAKHFVWLSIDIENSRNAAFLARHPIHAVPTVLIINPANENVAMRWLGGATVPQLQRLLADGKRAVSGGGDAADQLLTNADRLDGAGNSKDAIAGYQKALAAAPKGWSRFPRATESLILDLQDAGRFLECARDARDSFARVSKTPSAADVAGTGLDCAVSLDSKEGDRAALIATLEQDSWEVLGDRTTAMAADDRSAVYQEIIAARKDAKDDKGALDATQQWATFLEGEAAKGKTADERAVFDSHRLSAYLELKQPERAIPMLQASEHDLPNDYNPPARLAVAFKAMGKYDEALAASDRALPKAYGPRKLGILRTRAQIFEEKGDKAEAQKTMKDAIAMAESLPDALRSKSTIASLKKELDTLQR